MAPQKRSAQEADTLIDGVKAVIVDIEGTTTPISFVKDTLFPHVTKNLETYLDKHFDDTDTQKDIAALRSQATKEKDDGAVQIPDGEASKEEVIKCVAENVKCQMSKDSKSTELKQIQGHILKEGYKCGDLKAELFDEVPMVLQQLQDEDIKLYVYSSGSIEAQKLLFGHTAEGSLVELFTGFFDTTTGSKTESSSYKKIKEEIGCEPFEILFLTDKPAEAAAAVEAGLRSTLVIRPGNEDLEEEHLQNFSCIENFNELFGDYDYDDDLKRFEGDNQDDDEEDPDDDDDDEVDEENPEQEEEEDDA